MVIEYTPHAAQMEIHRARGFRLRTVCTGRRFGKTLCMAAELLDRGGGDPISPAEGALVGGPPQGRVAARQGASGIMPGGRRHTVSPSAEWRRSAQSLRSSRGS
jgi:hypothetical protein